MVGREPRAQVLGAHMRVDRRRRDRDVAQELLNDGQRRPVTSPSILGYRSRESGLGAWLRASARQQCSKRHEQQCADDIYEPVCIAGGGVPDKAPG